MQRMGVGLLAVLSLVGFSYFATFTMAADPPSPATAAVMMDPASPRVAMLKQIHLLTTPVDQVAAALDASHYRVAIIDGTAANLQVLQQHAKELDQFTAAGGWVMLWGVTPDGLATFNQLVGVDHIMRPFRMERVSATTSPSPLSAGIVSSDLAMESSKRTHQTASTNFASGDAWSYVVDLDDVARFAKLPPPGYWDAANATIGGDRWPENMTNGVDDLWQFSFTIPKTKPEYLTWPLILPRKEKIDGFSIERETLFARVTKVHLAFPGTDAKPVDLDVTQDQTQEFNFPPVLTDRVQMTIDTDNKNKLVTGIRKIGLMVQRSADFQAHVHPLASIGVLVAYTRGTGGIVLNEMNVPAVEDVPANGTKKRAILDALLRNMHAPFEPGTPVPPQKVQWLQKGTAWEDPANWLGGVVPGKTDIACFPAAYDSVASVNPILSKPAEVAGVQFDDDYGGRRIGPKPLAPGVKHMALQLAPSWTLSGSAPLAIGAAGVSVIGHAGSDIISCPLSLADPQTWRIGAMTWEPNVLIHDQYGNPFNLIVTGTIAGPGAWIKEGNGRVYYANNTAPTFTGGLTVRGTAVEWALTKLTAGGTYQFGTGPITLDGGSFCFGANDTPSKDTVEISNPIFVTPKNGMLEITAEKIAKVVPPLVRYTGPVHLSGNLKLAHSTQGLGTSGLDLVGPILLDQSVPRTLGLAQGDFVTGWSVFPIIRGDLHDEPGSAGSSGNPLVLRSLINSFVIAGKNNDYAEDTYIDTCGSRLFGGSVDAVVVAGPGAQLGKGDVFLQPGGHLNISDAANLAAGKSVTLASDAASLSVLGLAYNGLPTISPRSTGVIAIETHSFDAISDLAKTGDGTMRLGSFHGGTFTGKSLAPGAGNLYRLGGGGYGTLTIANPVLAGSAGVEVGSPAWWGFGNVLLAGANTFTGPLTVQSPAPPGQYEVALFTSLNGMAQTTPGASPFGSAQGEVNLDNANLLLTGVAGGQPVAKGPLTVEGHSTITLHAAKGPASLTFASLQRRGNSVLTVESVIAKSGGPRGELHISDWTKPIPLVDPYILYSDDFASYDPAKGLLPFAGYVTDIAKAGPDDVLRLGATALTGKAVHIKDLKTTGPITGNGQFFLSGGGLLATGDFHADVDFGNAEGVITGTCKLLGKISEKKGLTITEPAKFYRKQVGLLNSANDFTGPITVDAAVIFVRFDTQDKNGNDVPGSLGDLHNNIILNGGFIDRFPSGSEPDLAATRTITLGPAGGGFYFSYPPEAQTHIRAKITGPGMLTQFIEEGPGLIIDNPHNDYAGGTKICAGQNKGMTVGPLGKLGIGPVLIDPETQLVLQGDHNIDPHARLEVALGGIARCTSSAPQFGSLTGAGAVYIDGKSPTTLTVGSDDSDFTFLGSIIEEGGAPCAITKTGKGIWTLYGDQHCTGVTTVADGTLDLRGGVAGGVTVNAGASLVAHGTIAGDLVLAPHSTLEIPPTGTPMAVAGSITLSPDVTIHAPSAGSKWTILTSSKGINGPLPLAPKGYRLQLSEKNTHLELMKE